MIEKRLPSADCCKACLSIEVFRPEKDILFDEEEWSQPSELGLRGGNEVEVGRPLGRQSLLAPEIYPSIDLVLLLNGKVLGLEVHCLVSNIFRQT